MINNHLILSIIKNNFKNREGEGKNGEIVIDQGALGFLKGAKTLLAGADYYYLISFKSFDCCYTERCGHTIYLYLVLITVCGLSFRK